MLETSVLLTHSMFEVCIDEHPRLHAKRLDKILGYKIPKIEVKLLQKYRAYDRYNDDSNKKQHYKGTQTWIGLHPQALQTPYCDIYEALSLLKDSKIEHIVDIGAGYGRVGIVTNVLYPTAKFTGFEVVKQRQVEGNRVFKKLGVKNSKIELKNVLDSSFDLPEADIYFIYDFSEQDDVFQILKALTSQIQQNNFYLIIRGDRVDHLMKHKFKHIWRRHVSLNSSGLKIYTSRSV